jgi:hypothetical protein
MSSSLKGSWGNVLHFLHQTPPLRRRETFRDMGKRELSSPAPSPSPGVLIGHEPPLRLNPRFVPWACGLGKARDYQSLHEGCISQSQCVSTRQGLCSIEWTRRRRMQLMLPNVQRLDVVQRIPVEGDSKRQDCTCTKASQASPDSYREMCTERRNCGMHPCLLDLHALKCKHVFDILPATG